MAQVQLPNLDYLRQKDPKLYETVKAIQGVLAPATQDPPPPVTAINVVSLGNGSVDVTFADGGPVNQGVNYFVEHADNENYTNARVEDLGASRGRVIAIGSPARAFRVYSQYNNPPSLPNEPTVFGGAGTPVFVSGGGPTTPPLQPSTGSGTASVTGQQPGQGFGRNTVRPA
jgi:hypothetical protein